MNVFRVSTTYHFDLHPSTLQQLTWCKQWVQNCEPTCSCTCADTYGHMCHYINSISVTQKIYSHDQSTVGYNLSDTKLCQEGCKYMLLHVEDVVEAQMNQHK